MKMLLDDVIVVRGDCHEQQLNCLVFTECRFVRDFGPWKKDQVVVCLSWDFERGTVRSIDSCGATIQSCKFTLTPAEE